MASLKLPPEAQSPDRLTQIIEEAGSWIHSSSLRELRQTLHNILDIAHGKPLGTQLGYVAWRANQERK